MTQSIIGATQHWLTEIVIGQQFCPFAQKPFIQNAIHYHVNQSKDWADIQSEFIAQLTYLEANPNTATTLFILDWPELDFYDYLDGLMLCQHTLETQGFEGVFQLASFHPAYQFEGEPASSASHFTNRAPFPIFHLLREDSLTQALDNMPNAHTIPEDNIKRAQQLGVAYFEQVLAQAHNLQQQ